jgi:hypothetical protein
MLVSLEALLHLYSLSLPEQEVCLIHNLGYQFNVGGRATDIELIAKISLKPLQLPPGQPGEQKAKAQPNKKRLGRPSADQRFQVAPDLIKIGLA